VIIVSLHWLNLLLRTAWHSSRLRLYKTLSATYLSQLVELVNSEFLTYRQCPLHRCFLHSPKWDFYQLAFDKRHKHWRSQMACFTRWYNSWIVEGTVSVKINGFPATAVVGFSLTNESYERRMVRHQYQLSSKEILKEFFQCINGQRFYLKIPQWIRDAVRWKLHKGYCCSIGQFAFSTLWKDWHSNLWMFNIFTV